MKERLESKAVTAIAIALILLGIAPRCAEFFSGRPLWLDESQLAVNALDKSFIGMCRPLENNQVAPPAYMWMQKAGVLCLGADVYAVRWPSLAAGILGLVLFWCMARNLASRTGALIGLAFVAFSQHLIYYAGEAKPYELDAFFTVLILWLAVRLEQGEFRRGRAICLAVAGAMAVWASYSSVFVLGGVGVTQLVLAGLRRDRRALLTLMGAYGAAAFSFTLHYFLVMRPIMAASQSVGYMDYYWRHGFMPFPPKSLFQLRWFRERPFMFLDMPGGFTLPELALFASITGIIGFFSRSKRALFFICLPFAFTLLASGFRLYPFHARMTLFLAPLLFLLIGEGIAFLAEGRGRAGMAAGAVLLTLLIAQPAFRAARTAIQPSRHHELDLVLEYAKTHWQEGDRIYLQYHDGLAYRFMEERLALSPEDVISAAAPAQSEDEVLRQFRPGQRWWFPLTYDNKNAAEPLLKTLQSIATQEDAHEARGAAIWACRRLPAP